MSPCLLDGILQQIKHFPRRLFFSYSVIRRAIGPLQLTVTWYKNRPVETQETHWDKTTKITILNDVSSLFVLSQCVSCVPTWRFLHHVTVSCKGPIQGLFSDASRQNLTVRLQLLSCLVTKGDVLFTEKILHSAGYHACE